MSDDIRQPPHDITAEQAVLGAMMASDKAITEVAVILGDGSGFYRPAHGIIYRTILELRDNGEPTDPIVVTSKLVGSGQITKVGGAEYLHTCYAAMTLTGSPAHHARIVSGCATLRTLAQYAAKVQQIAGAANHTDATDALERARQLLADLDAGNIRPDSLRLWKEMTPGLLEEVERAEQLGDEPLGVPTGLHDLDDLLGGLRPGELVLVGARPGVGKSVLLLNIATHAAMRHKLRTVMFSLEMSEKEIGLRIAAAGTNIPLKALRSGRLEDGDWSKLARFVGDTDDAPLHVDETAKATLAHIRAAVKRVIAQYGYVDLILVDYLQLTEGGGRDSRQESVAALSRGLKLLAKETGAPVVAASQLNRGPEQRTDKRPQSSDLRESGALEQDADVVMLLHREDVNDHESPRAGECDVIVSKNRHGPQDTITVASRLHVCRFESMAVV